MDQIHETHINGDINADLEGDFQDTRDTFDEEQFIEMIGKESLLHAENEKPEFYLKSTDIADNAKTKIADIVDNTKTKMTNSVEESNPKLNAQEVNFEHQVNQQGLFVRMSRFCIDKLRTIGQSIYSIFTYPVYAISKIFSLRPETTERIKRVYTFCILAACIFVII